MQLAEYGTNPEVGCSEAFVNSLRKFLEGCGAKLEKKMKYLEDYDGEDRNDILEVSNKIWGFTEKQLEVLLY